MPTPRPSLRRSSSRFRTVLLLAACTIAAVLAAPSAASARPVGPSWTLLDTGSSSHFRGLAAVSRKVAWVGGYHGTILRTTDGGRSWSDVSPAGAQKLQFRDISAFDAQHAVAMAAGPVGKSRLYVTTDGGVSWQLAYRNRDASAFFDCMSFYDAGHGLVMSDPVDGKFRILSTTDGGASWSVLPTGGMPAALDGEFGFAASGECLTTTGHDAWFGTGGTDTSRIFHSADGGLTWDVTPSPIVSGPSAGVFGLAFRSPRLGVAVGGDFAAPAADVDVAAYFAHGGPWTVSATQPSGYRSGVAFVPGTHGTVVAVGLTGSDISYDAGRHWATFDTGQFDTVACAPGGACWASGDDGRVAVLKS